MRKFSRFAIQGIGSLGAGGAIQIASYFGIFLALFIAGRLLPPIEFGLYAGLTATASLAGSVFTFGADKMLTNLAARHESRRFPLSSPASCQTILYLAVNLVLLGLGGGAFVMELIDLTQFLTLLLALAIALKMVIGGHLRGSGKLYVGLIAIFSLQPLVLGIGLGIAALFEPSLSRGFTLATILSGAAAIELGFAIWFAALTGRVRFHLPRRRLARLIRMHSAIAMRITTWNLLAQSSLLSVAIVTATFSPIQVAQYGLACRVSQILLMPWNSGMQMLIPRVAQFDRNRDNSAILTQLRQLTRLVFLAILAICAGFVVAGYPVMNLFFQAFDQQAFAIAMVFVVGNIIFAYFGLGDQGLIATNRLREAQRITVISTSVALAGYLLCIIADADVIVIAIIMMLSMLLRQIWSETALFAHTGIRTRVSFR